MLYHMGELGHSAPPLILEPQPTGLGEWQHSLLKPRLGYRMRRIYKMDI
jgi:hypothetical protein